MKLVLVLLVLVAVCAMAEQPAEQDEYGDMEPLILLNDMEAQNVACTPNRCNRDCIRRGFRGGRATTDPRNVLTVVLELLDNGLHRVGNREGVLERAVASNQLAKVKEPFLRLEDVPRDKTLALRTMATATSHSGGQGFTRCLCTKGCTHKKCGCIAKKEICKSHCHGGTPCANK